MPGAIGVEALQQVAGCVGVIPVVAAVVDDHVVAGFPRQGARVFHQVVAGEQNLEDRIPKGLVFAAHVGRRGHAARARGIGPRQFGQERRPPGLVAGRLGQVLALKEGADRGRKLSAQVVFGEKLAHIGYGGVVGRSGPGGERIERAQRHVGKQQADLERLGRGHRQAAAFYRGKMLAESIDLIDRRARRQQQSVERDGVLERDVRIEGQIEHGRAAAGDEEEDEGILAVPCAAEPARRVRRRRNPRWAGDGRSQSSGSASCA